MLLKLWHLLTVESDFSIVLWNGRSLNWVSENLHLEFSSASPTCVTWGKPHNLLTVTFLLAKKQRCRTSVHSSWQHTFRITPRDWSISEDSDEG